MKLQKGLKCVNVMKGMDYLYVKIKITKRSSWFNKEGTEKYNIIWIEIFGLAMPKFYTPCTRTLADLYSNEESLRLMISMVLM